VFDGVLNNLTSPVPLKLRPYDAI